MTKTNALLVVVVVIGSLPSNPGRSFDHPIARSDDHHHDIHLHWRRACQAVGARHTACQRSDDDDADDDDADAADAT